MPRCRSGRLFTNLCVLAVAAALAACSHAEAVNQLAAAPVGPAPSPAAAPMTREKASTDCWMKYDKEGRGLSLDRRLPLVEKCTAEKLKAAAR